MPNKLTIWHYIFMLPLILFSQCLIGAEEVSNIKISILGNDAILLEPGGARYQKPTLYYEENKDRKYELNVLISNLSDKNMALIGLPFSSLIVTILDSEGKKHIWPPYTGISSSAFKEIIYLDKNENLLFPIPIRDFESYMPPIAGKKENIKVTAKFITLEGSYKGIPVDLLKSKVKFAGEIESEQKEMTIYNITGLLPPDKKASPKKQMAIQKEEIKIVNEKKAKYIDPDIIVNHFEVEDFSFSDTIEFMADFLNEYIKKEYPSKNIKISILNTLSEKDYSLHQITISADKVTIEELLSMICKQADLKYVIGKDAIYIGY